MSDRSPGSHPDLDRLARYGAGELAPAEAAEIERHLGDCPACRLELISLRRFEALGDDAELGAEARWPQAAEALDRAFQEKILPAARGDTAAEPAAAAGTAAAGAGATKVAGRIRPRRRWLVPAIAAAALALAVLGPAVRRGLLSPSREIGPVRGDSGLASTVIPEWPVGTLTAMPERFVWRAAGKFDSFTLEILTPRLETVFTFSGVPDTAVAATDSLRARLAPGGAYLWSVRGFRGLTESAASPYAWFALPEPKR